MHAEGLRNPQKAGAMEQRVLPAFKFHTASIAYQTTRPLTGDAGGRKGLLSNRARHRLAAAN